MATATRFGVLFEVEIRHDYFQSLGSRVEEALDDAARAALRRGYSVPSFLRIFPTPDCVRTLAGHRAIFKSTATGFLVGIRLDPAAVDARPALPPGADFRLRFAFATRDPRFYNYTALPEPAGSFCLLGNSSANETAGGLFLTRPVPAFSAARAYRAGEIRAVAAGPAFDLFRAERDTGPSALPAPADWRRIPPDTFEPAESYLSGAVVLFANRLYRALKNGPGPDLNDAAAWQPIGLLANQYLSAADFLPVGTSEAAQAAGEGWLGVIEIGPGTGGLALLDGGGALRTPRYTLRFMNRASRWRYIFPAAQALGAGAEVAAEGGNPRVLVTPETRPLTRNGRGVRLRADIPATPGEEEVLLPEPETRSLRRQNLQWFSEIHSTNLPL